MNIVFENPDKINGLMTITVEEADFKDNVEKTLKDYRKRANVPGFRPGKVPMSLIKRQIGASAKMDAVNKVVGEQLYKYIQDNKIQMLGEPLPSEQQVPVDLEQDGPYTFKFDIAVAPEFKIELTNKDKVNYYTIDVDDKLIDQQVDMYASRSGKYEKVEDFEGNDMLKGDIRELDADGNTKEGGITVESAVLMPEYIKVEEQKNLFKGAKLGDIITFNPKKAYPENLGEISSLLKITREEAEQLTADFSYQITEISRFTKAPVNQELFDQVYGTGNVTSEADFRERIAAELKTQLAGNSNWKFLRDLRAYCEKKVGELTYPEAILKRVMQLNNKDKDADYIEKNYEGSIKELTWHLIKEQLVAATGIKIGDDDVKQAAKEAARAQFAQYGMSNVPEEYLDNYAGEMLKKQENAQGFVDRAIDVKLTEALMKVVKLNEKKVSLDEFNKLMSE
ncbi:MAG: trigger factor [Prevotella sp.]|jgi:trigger factor|nr:trigger factor [Prevotella sp.]